MSRAGTSTPQSGHDTGCRGHASATRMQRWEVEHLGKTCRKLSTSACRLIHAPGLLQWPPPSTLSRKLDWVLKSTLRVYCPIHLTTPARGVIAGGGRAVQTPCQCMAPPPGFQGQVRVLVSCPNRRSLWRGALASARGRSPRKGIKSAARSRWTPHTRQAPPPQASTVRTAH